MGKPASIDPVLSEKILSIATIYEELLSIYANQKVFFLKDSPLTGQRGRWWKKAVELADAAGLDYRFFVKANFYWIHQWYHTAAKPLHLANQKAVERAQRYRNLIDRGYVNADTEIRGLVHPERKGLRPMGRNKTEVTAAVDAHNIRLLETLLAAHPGLDKAAIFQVFRAQFDQTWLKQHTEQK